MKRLKVIRLLLKHLDGFENQLTNETRFCILKEITRSYRGNGMTAFLLVTYVETLTEKVEGLTILHGFDAKLQMKKLIKSNQQCHPRPRLRQVLSFQTLYIGISPKTGPSLYTIIPMIEWLYGVWFIKGGMYAMASGMERLFLELGGQICCQKTVKEVLIADQVAKGIKLADQTVTQSDFVIVNDDFPYAMKHLVTDKKAKGKYTDDKIDQMSYSCSCFVLYLGLNRKYDQVKNVHNFVFSNDLDDNISAIFDGKLLEDPSFYVYMASKLDPSLAPSDKDGVYLLTPVPDLETAQYDWTDKTTTYYRQKLVDGLKKVPGFETVEEDIVCETAMTPPDFLKRFNAYRGACFGLQPTLTQSNHLRPQSKAKNCERLYFTGSSTHPGAGVPIVLLSAKIAVDELLSDDLGIEPQPLSI